MNRPGASHIGLKRKRDQSTDASRWRLGIIALLLTLMAFTRNPSVRDTGLVNKVYEYDGSGLLADSTEEIVVETSDEPSAGTEDEVVSGGEGEGEEEGGFDSLHDDTDSQNVVSEQESVHEDEEVKEEEEEESEAPTAQMGWSKGSQVDRWREAHVSTREENSEPGHRERDSSTSRSSSGSSSKSKDPPVDRIYRMARGKGRDCKSGDVDSQRHIQRVWGNLDNSRLNFRVSGDMLPDQKNRMPIILNSKQFLRFNRTLARKQVKDSLVVKVLGEPEWKLHFDPKLIALLPNSEPSWHFKSCSVVGNSGEVLNKEYGSEIDSHQAVFRLNYAPTRGFERYVGSRTTFDVVNQQHTKVFVPEVHAGGNLPEAKRSSARESIITVFEVDKPFASRQLYPPLLRRFNSANSRSKSRVAIISPELVLHSHHVWKRMKRAVEAAAQRPTHYHSKPMSGFFAIMLGVQICEQVHLYGFSPYKKGEKLYHYFDATPAVTTAHSFDLGFEIFRQMATWPCSDVKVYIHYDRGSRRIM